MASELLEWDRVTGNEGYKVEWGTSSGAWDSYANSATTATNTESYTATGLTTGVVYYWRVAALVGGVDQTPSDESAFIAGQSIQIGWFKA